eukprot:4215337-Amphidinium_carterae.1
MTESCKAALCPEPLPALRLHMRERFALTPFCHPLSYGHTNDRHTNNDEIVDSTFLPLGTAKPKSCNAKAYQSEYLTWPKHRPAQGHD